jgi:hypothetical protein
MRVFLKMKQQIYLQEQELNVRSQDLNQPVAFQLEMPRERSRTGRHDKLKKKTMEIHNWTQTGKRTFCQKNKGFVEIKQRPITMDSRTIYKTLSSKGTPFQTRIDG